MTHSGGQPHAVGDRGQRYEVSVYDDSAGRRIVIGWADDAAMASNMATAAELRPSWMFAWVTDRRAAIPRDERPRYLCPLPGCPGEHTSKRDICQREERPSGAQEGT